MLSYKADEKLKLSVEKASTNCLEKNPDSLLLIGGEMAGIQDFIYDIVRKAAAKNLKGRSFYLQLVVDSIVMSLIETLEITPEHIIYASGGGFYIIAPNTDVNQTKITDFRVATTQKLFEQHGISLGFSLDFVVISKTELETALPKKWEELITTVLQPQKKQRLMPILKTKSSSK